VSEKNKEQEECKRLADGFRGLQLPGVDFKGPDDTDILISKLSRLEKDEVAMSRVVRHMANSVKSLEESKPHRP